MATTAATIIRGAFETIGVLGEGETLSAAKGADGLRRLNLMLGSWAIQRGTIPVIAREVFALVANQTSYTIGVGGNFNTARPSRDDLVGAGIVLTASTPTTELQIAVYTDAAYEDIAVKGLANGLPQGVYYSPTFPLGTILPWAIPNTAVNSLVLYLRKALVAFTSLPAVYELPSGADEAMEYNLALRLCGPYSVPVDPDVKAMARSSLAAFKRSNYRTDSLANGVWGALGRYDINSGSTVRRGI
jgi:hypothetical protein